MELHVVVVHLVPEPSQAAEFPWRPLLRRLRPVKPPILVEQLGYGHSYYCSAEYVSVYRTYPINFVVSHLLATGRKSGRFRQDRRHDPEFAMIN